ncbi:MAG: SpoIIE family protein phosphatase [Candidatus Omnitrophica bacterium]|nr:SpoIIE family protein phosphatase [Candidatus Omnitrophota bacterium]
MAYQHIDIDYLQSSKKEAAPCGDTVWFKRTLYHTTIICADGISSGVKAFIASQMNVARIGQLLEGGASFQETFQSVVNSMSQWRDYTMPFTAFIMVRTLIDGTTTILNYEMPSPILVTRNRASVVKAEPMIVEAGVASSFHCRFQQGDSIILMSDGITQSGMGTLYPNGWGSQGVEKCVNQWLRRGSSVFEAMHKVFDQAKINDGEVNGDDRTVMYAQSRLGRVVEVLTGPPLDEKSDEEFATRFLESDGTKVICGATTADIVARYKFITLQVEQNPSSMSTPPRYYIDGVDLVTEGAVTLNQVHNLLEEEDLDRDSDMSAAVDLAKIFKSGDRIIFTVGQSLNPANKNIVFRKQGILQRNKIIPMIAQKLEKMGKLVSIEHV